MPSFRARGVTILRAATRSRRYRRAIARDPFILVGAEGFALLSPTQASAHFPPRRLRAAPCRRFAHADQVADVLKFDMHQHWESKARFLSRLSKAQIVEVMTEAECWKTDIKTVEKVTKAEAVTKRKRR